MVSSRPPSSRLRRLRFWLLAAFFALPAVGGLLSFIEVLRDGFSGVDGLAGVTDVALSPGGAQVYAVGRDDNALAVFSRNLSAGNLSFVEVHEDEVNGVFGMLGASSVATSPDGRHVYVTADTDDTLVVFSRDASTDELTFLAAELKENNVGGVFGLDGVSDVTVSPDDTQVFVTARVDDAVAVFSRDATSDELTLVEVELNNMGGAISLDGATAVAVSPDSEHVYVASFVDDAVAIFQRNMVDGTLTFEDHVRDGIGGVDGLDGASGIAVSPDGSHVYVTGEIDNALAVFARDAMSGHLTFVAVYPDGVGGIDGLGGASAVTLNPTGERVLVAGKNDNAVAVFRRTPATGMLDFLEILRDGFGGIDGLAGVLAIAASDDGEHAYAAGHEDDAIAGFDVVLCIGDEATGDTDGDAFCDDIDICFGDDIGGDGDGDGVCEDVDVCPGFDDMADMDGDGVPDGCDVCTGDDATGDTDSDGVCNDSDVCAGFSDLFDTDGDGVPDGCDLCDGDDATGDGDGDNVCDDTDVCAGFDDALDADGDGRPDGCDVCTGDDDTGDTDGDGVCDDVDACMGSDDALDADGDGVPDSCDVCLGDDATGDSDGDGVCDDIDVCAGFDDSVDGDGDGVPDRCDVCVGDDATGDGDVDGVCDDTDVCPGFNDLFDADGDGIPDGCDFCAGNDATGDADGDGACDDIDACPGFNDALDADGDDIPDGCDVCPTDDGVFADQTVTGPTTLAAQQTVTLGLNLTLDGTTGPIVVQASQSIAVLSGTSFSGQVSLEIVASPCN